MVEASTSLKYPIAAVYARKSYDKSPADLTPGDTVLLDTYSPYLREAGHLLEAALGLNYGGAALREDFHEIHGFLNNQQKVPIEVIAETKGLAVYEPVDGNLTGARSVKRVNPRREGESRSRAETARQAYMNTVSDEHGVKLDTKAWMEFLAEEGYEETTTPSHVGAEEMTAYAKIDGTIPGVYLALVTATDLYQRAEEEAGEYANNPKALEKFLESTLLHEIGHLAGIDGEKKMGELMAKFYSQRKEAYKGTELEKVYERLEEQAEEYAEQYSLGNRISRYFQSNASAKELSKSELESLVSRYSKEAVEVNTNSVEKYVTNKLKEYIKKKGKSEKYKKGKCTDEDSNEEEAEENPNEDPDTEDNGETEGDGEGEGGEE